MQWLPFSHFARHLSAQDSHDKRQKQAGNGRFKEGQSTATKVLIILMDDQGLDETKRNSYALVARQSRVEFFVIQSSRFARFSIKLSWQLFSLL
jgi:hypothetical protein